MCKKDRDKEMARKLIAHAVKRAKACKCGGGSKCGGCK